jgi:hypothetical protein
LREGHIPKTRATPTRFRFATLLSHCIVGWSRQSERETTPRARAQELDCFTVLSTVGEFFAAKLRNSLKCSANRIRSVHLLKTSCATLRKHTQLVRLELEIRCSIRLSYGHTIRHIPRLPPNKSCCAQRFLLLLLRDEHQLDGVAASIVH